MREIKVPKPYTNLIDEAIRNNMAHLRTSADILTLSRQEGLREAMHFERLGRDNVLMVKKNVDITQLRDLAKHKTYQIKGF